MLAAGGPQPESTVEFHVADTAVGVISQNGVIEARSIGQATINARAVGFDVHLQHVVYSQVVMCYCLNLPFRFTLSETV